LFALSLEEDFLAFKSLRQFYGVTSFSRYSLIEFV
jgi:hypothetical protein